LFGIVARDYFSESTLGVPAPADFEGDVESLPDAVLWKTLFHTNHFQISVVPDVEGVSLCGALKSPSLLVSYADKALNLHYLCFIDIVALAAGFIDGLGWGSNTKGPSHRSSSHFSGSL